MMAVRVYASRARADTYLYVPAEPDLARVPEPLLAQLQPLRNAPGAGAARAIAAGPGRCRYGAAAIAQRRLLPAVTTGRGSWR